MPRPLLKCSECLSGERRHQKVMYGEDGIEHGSSCSGSLVWMKMASGLQLGGCCSYVGSGTEMTQDGAQMDGHGWRCQQALKILEEKAVSDVLDRMRNRRKRFAGLTKLDVDVTQTQTWWPLTGTSMLWRGDMPRWEEGMWLLRLNNILGGRKQLRVGLIEDNGPILWEQRWKKSILLRVCTENL